MDFAVLLHEIEGYCTSRAANDVAYDLSEPNPKYYYGTSVRVDITFVNLQYSTVDFYLQGTISVQNAKTPQPTAVVRDGVGRLIVNLNEEEFTNGNELLLEFTPRSFFNDQKIRNIRIKIPVVKKASKGELLIHNNQLIYSGKEFTLYFKLFDSDNKPTPVIDIPLLSISSANPNDKLYCQLTNYINGYGFATCANIDTSGQHSLVLKYNNVVLDEYEITVEENPYQFVNEAIVLLLVILVIVSLLILCVGIVSFVFFYKKLNKQNGMNTRPGRVNREEDAEELDNL
ncbi:predicted protein [Naegleria gruberi]|uniref:Predicted protein n=1 Tax=Naegleria gruberi TaxID=5762 RepID=D2VWK3_NAEGR|nr:uncharacterized protein NAEGRDRAFT_59417 [Naegleria gruberi]EFC38856.1 predicted protein [Naegleria gruberi]|eukprot:XP_002671600.1 predicted protein [Naegleria gruberi strain NEG-M]